MKPIAALLFHVLMLAATFQPAMAANNPVASTYFQIRDVADPARQAMLCGSNINGVVHYVDELLQDPKAARHVEVGDPTEVAGLGTTIPFYYFVLYPTTPENPHADVKMFDHFSLPRMDGPADRPMIAPTKQPYPIIAFSHGFNVHPFYDLPNMVALASHGYVVICIFHGDGRFTRHPLQAETAKIRARSVAACVDDLVGDKSFAPYINPKTCGVFGISRGGNAAGRLLGACSYDQDRSCVDPRFIAAFGESPALAEFEPLEDLDFSSVTAPFFAIDGSEDQLPPIINRVLSTSKGPSVFVELAGQGHVPTDATKERVISTWALDFFDAYLYADQNARARLGSRNSVPGDIANVVKWRINMPETRKAQN